MTQRRNIVLCLVDATRGMFALPYIQNGNAGAQRASDELISGMQQHIADEIDNPTFYTHIYVDKRKLTEDLVASKSCTQDQLDHFFSSLNRYSDSTSIVDVTSKYEADSKIQSMWVIPLFKPFSNPLPSLSPDICHSAGYYKNIFRGSVPFKFSLHN